MKKLMALSLVGAFAVASLAFAGPTTKNVKGQKPTTQATGTKAMNTTAKAGQTPATKTTGKTSTKKGQKGTKPTTK